MNTSILREPYSSAAAILALVIASITTVPPSAAQRQNDGRMLLPNTSYSRGDIVGDADGKWQMLKMGNDGSYSVADVEVVSKRVQDICVDNDGEATGREVMVPESAAVLLMRRIAGVKAGPAPSAYWDVGEAYTKDEVELGWSASVYRLRWIPVGKGRRLIFSTPSGSQTIFSAEWADDASWLLRWAGDINGDGALDLILDASHKYSVSVTRLFLSKTQRDGATLEEVATLTTYAC